jgi:hypothetical protein
VIDSKCSKLGRCNCKMGAASATQELEQQVCQKYGWSARFEQEQVDDDDDVTDASFCTTVVSYCWVCYVTVRLHDERRFVSSSVTSTNKNNNSNGKQTTSTSSSSSCSNHKQNDTNNNKDVTDVETQKQNNHTTLTEKERKEGIAAASMAALDGLREEIARQEAKPKKELTQVFSVFPSDAEKDDTKSDNRNNHNHKPRFLIKGSTPQNWETFIWSKKPQVEVVDIGTEGNSNKNMPPVLVQIATQDCVIVEITNMNRNMPGNEQQQQLSLSNDLQRLLSDDDITKVFCDNYGHNDKRSLGLLLNNNDDDDAKEKEKEKIMKKKVEIINNQTTLNHSTCTRKSNNDFSEGPVVDLEVLASKANMLGPVKVARGLSRIVTLTMPELNVLVGKPPRNRNSNKGRGSGSGRTASSRWKDIGRFTLIEQGKAPPLTSLRDLSRRELEYAAVDAWATLQAYHRLT